MKSLIKKIGRVLLPPKTIPPTFLIIGAQKAGTTPLVRYLAQHPQLLIASDKEVDYFGSSTRHPLGKTFYHRYFRTRHRQKRQAFEASPHYLLAPNAAKQIQAYNPEARLIALLRDPVSRAFSAYKMYQRFLSKDPQFFDSWNARYYAPEEQQLLLKRPEAHATNLVLALEAEIEALRNGQLYEWHLLEYGLYARNLEPFFQHIPKENLLLLSSQELGDETADTLDTITSFLKIDSFDWQHADLRKSHQETKGATMPEAARQLLEEFYHEPNRDLERITGRRFY